MNVVLHGSGGGLACQKDKKCEHLVGSRSRCVSLVPLTTVTERISTKNGFILICGGSVVYHAGLHLSRAGMLF